MRPGRRPRWLQALVALGWAAVTGCAPPGGPQDRAAGEAPGSRPDGAVTPDAEQACWDPERGDFDILCLLEAEQEDGGDSGSAGSGAGASDGPPSNRPCFHPELGDFDISCLTDGQIAALLSDLDKDGRNNLDELKAGTDPYDAVDGPDIDGDGTLNGNDADVDGDGVPNKRDYDVNGNRIFNDYDPDIDSDGLLNRFDPDQDGDGLSDRFDLDDDADDEPDDEDDDEDDDDDPPKEKLEDLIDRLKDGKLTDADKNAIAQELTERLATPEKAAAIAVALVDVIAEASSQQRQKPDTDIPLGIAAVDAVYRQLADSLAYVKGRQDDQKAPLDKEKLAEVALDFLPRAQGVARLARTFETLPIDDLAAVTSDLRAATGPTRFPEVSRQLASIVDPDSRGDAESERQELALLTGGLSRLANAFPEALGGDLVDALGRIRSLVGDQIDLESAEVDRLLDRVEELGASDLPLTLVDAIGQIEDEERGSQDDPADEPDDPPDPGGEG